MKRSTLLLSTLGLFTGQTAAGEATVLDTVVVSATRSEQTSVPTPASISVINAQDIERSGARNVAELLRGRAGIQVRDYFGDGSSGAVFDMRGFGATAVSNTLIMVDGRRLNNGSDIAAPDVTTISLKNIERIEIVQGSAGTLFGNQAVGGVINIITRSPQEFHAELNGKAGSYNSHTLTGSVSDRFSNGISYRLAVESRDSDNYRDNNSLDYENVVGRIDYDHARGRLFAEIHQTQEELELPGALYTNEIRADRRQSTAINAHNYQDANTTLGRVGLSQDLNSHWSLEAEMAYRDVERSFIQGSPGDMARDVYTLTPRLVGAIPFNGGEAQITVGADLEKTDYSLESSFGLTEVAQRIYAYYLQGVIPIDDKWSVTAGARRAMVRNDLTAMKTFGASPFAGGESLDDEVAVGTLGLVFRPNSAWRLFARADQNFRFATADEHAYSGGSATGLKNQTGVSYELGGEWSGENGSFKATAYRLDLEDEISYDRFFNNINLDSTRRNGLILEATARVHRDVDVGLNYQFVDAETKSGEFAGNRVPEVAEHSATLFADYRPIPDLNLHAEAKYVGDQVLSGDFDNSLPELEAFTVVNLSGEYRIDGWRFGARINNLFDREYSEIGVDWSQAAYYPSPERNFWLTVGYDFD